MHGAYITTETGMATYDILFYSMMKCIIRQTQIINYSTFNANKTQLLYTVQCKTEMFLRQNIKLLKPYSQMYGTHMIIQNQKFCII